MKESVPRQSRKVQQSEATRAHILRVARRLFAQRGYAGTSIEDLVERVRMTRGALYHHFRDKKDLFRAVWEQAIREAHANIIAAAEGGSDLWDRLRRGREAFLDSWTDPEACRIALVDGPSVLGLEERRQIQNSMGAEFADNSLLEQSLKMLVDAGEVGPLPMGALATVLGGAFDAAALAIASADDKQKARREIGSALNLLVDGLKLLASSERSRRKSNPSVN